VVLQTLLDAAEARVAQVIKRLRDCCAQVRSAIRLGHPATEILAVAKEQDADLIAVGARSQTRPGPFRLGGVAQKVTKYAACSVLVVREK
jgi:nucleotide-binding universal stress UspA family protein